MIDPRLPDEAGTLPPPDGHLDGEAPRSWLPAVVRGGIGFMLVSLGAFAVWALGGGWFRGRGGEPAMYAVITVVFLGLTGVVLRGLVRGPRALARCYGAFIPAFLAYAFIWSACWFGLGAGIGEWLGALVGCLAFVAVSAWRLGRGQGLLLATVVFFAAHTAGYYAGGVATARGIRIARQAPAGSSDRAFWLAAAKLGWGVGYGLGFGAGLGYLYHCLQRPRRTDSVKG